MTPQEFIIAELTQSGGETVPVYRLYDLFIQRTGSGMSRETYERQVRLHAATITAEKNIEGVHVSREYDGPDLNIATTSSDIRTLDQLLKYCKVDLEKYYVSKHVVNSWGSATNENFQVKAWLREIDPEIINEREGIKALLDDLKNDPPAIKTPRHKTTGAGQLLEISLFDHHFGQLSWGEETRGENYDIDIASSLALEAVSNLLHRAGRGVEKILLPIGNDFFNVNSSANATVAGTPQSEDDRWKKTYVKAKRLWIDIINMCLAVAPVDVLIVPGNHDEERIFYLGDTLESFYSNVDAVHIDNTPPLRKYYEFGKCAIMFTHGDKEVKGTQHSIFAAEMPELWARTKYREIHKGHLHHAKKQAFQIIDEFHGVREYVLPSLVSADDWHSGKGYSALRETTAFLWDKEHGKQATLYFHPMGGMK